MTNILVQNEATHRTNYDLSSAYYFTCMTYIEIGSNFLNYFEKSPECYANWRAVLKFLLLKYTPYVCLKISQYSSI